MSRLNDTLNEEAPLHQIPFFAGALSRFPTASSTLEPLKKLGYTNSSLDISHPDAKTVNAVEILGALACHVQARGPSTAAFISRHWQGLIGRWFKFLLEKYVLVDAQNSPHTTEGADMFEHIMTGCSVLLAFPEEAPQATFQVMLSSPWIQHLLIQVWLKAIDTTHPSWGNWGLPIGMIATMIAVATANGDVNRSPPNIPDPSTPILYRTKDREVGGILARHLMHEARRIPKMSLLELGHLKLFTMITTQHAFFDGVHPMLMYKNLQYSIPAHVEMLRGLLCKRKTLKKARLQDRECVDAFQIVLSVMIIFSEDMVHDPNRVRDMLKGGLLEAIFQAFPCYFLKEQAESFESFGQCGAEVVELISKFLVYGTVLREFVRVVKHIQEDMGDLEVAMQSKSAVIWDAWQSAKYKAQGFYQLYRTAKEVSNMCSNEACKTGDNLSAGDLRNVQYRRCVACGTAIYCSKECQRVHWRLNHHERCTEITQVVQGGLGVAVSYQDFQLWRRWIDLYLHQNANKIESMITDLSDFIVNEHFDDPQISMHLRMRTKTPYLVLQFHTPFIMEPIDTIWLGDTTALRMQVQPKHRWEGTGIIEKAIQTWNSLAIRDNNLLVLAVFPRNHGFAFAYQQIVDYPIRRSLEGAEKQQEFWLRKEEPFESFEKDVLEMAHRKVTTWYQNE